MSFKVGDLVEVFGNFRGHIVDIRGWEHGEFIYSIRPTTVTNALRGWYRGSDLHLVSPLVQLAEVGE